MDIKLQSKNLEINDGVRKYVTRKLNQIPKHLPSATRVELELASEPTRSPQDRVVAQVTLMAGGSILRAEQRESNINAAINGVLEVLDRRIARFKSRSYRSERAKRNVPLRVREAERGAQLESFPEGELPPENDLVKIKRFEMKPMTVEEAALQMQMLGHTFFMFLDRESSQYCVVYLRDAGNYGLIQPMVDPD